MYKLPFHDDETAAGFCSRLAAACGVGSDAFCADMGFSYPGILRAEETSLRLLAEVSSVPFERLQRNAVRPLKQGQSILRGELLRTPHFQTATSRLCPRCVDDDRSKGSGPSRSYDRLHWHFRFVRACPIHNVEIFNGPGRFRDFTALLQEEALAIHKAAQSRTRKEFSGSNTLRAVW